MQRGSTVSVHVKRWLLLCIKRWSPLHMNRWLPLWMKRQSPLLILWRDWMINAEKINSQLSHGKFKRFNLFFLHVGIKTVCITVYKLTQRGSTVSACERHLPLHVKRWSPLHMKGQLPLYDPKGDCLSWSWGLMINAERINSQLSNEKFKRVNLFFLYVGIKTVYNWCQEDQQSLYVWRWLPLHVKRGSPLHV